MPSGEEGKHLESEKRAGREMSTSLKENDLTQNSFSFREMVRIVVKTAYYMGSAFLLIIMFLVTIDVAGRALLNKPLWGVLEISEFLLAGAVLLGLGYTEFLNGNVMVELVYNRFSARWQNILRIFSCLVGIGFYGAVAWASGILTIELMKAHLTSDVLKIPAWPFRAFVPVGSLLMVSVLSLKLFDNIQEFRTRGKSK
jgi:TRAP-type C4-dicarboxylate transport system permease small subunit